MPRQRWLLASDSFHGCYHSQHRKQSIVDLNGQIISLTGKRRSRQCGLLAFSDFQKAHPEPSVKKSESEVADDFTVSCPLYRVQCTVHQMFQFAAATNQSCTKKDSTSIPVFAVNCGPPLRVLNWQSLLNSPLEWIKLNPRINLIVRHIKHG